MTSFCLQFKSANRFELSELEPVRYIETADVNSAILCHVTQAVNDFEIPDQPVNRWHGLQLTRGQTRPR